MRRRPIVVKFGGESLADPDRVRKAIEALQKEGRPVVVIVSARAGVTDLLRTLIKDGNGRPAPESVAQTLDRAHPGLPRAGRRSLSEIVRLAKTVPPYHAPPPAVGDELLSQGERLAAHWFAAHLSASGFPAEAIEADHLGLLTENSYGGSRILLARSQRSVRTGLTKRISVGVIPVVTGFFGRSLEGRVATLGRGGSDYSASAIGALLHAERVELIKAHVAISTADPRIVRSARRVERLSYDEAEEVAQFGARVLHPVTIEPVRAVGVELTVRSLADASHCTTIGPRPGERHRLVTRLGPLRLISVRIAGGSQRPGVIAEISRRLVDAHVTLAAVVTTEAVLGLLVDPGEAQRARRALVSFAPSAGAVLGRPAPVSLVSVVGEGVLREVRRVPPNLLRRSAGLLATARSISIVVPDELSALAVRGLHRAFVEPRRGSRTRRSPSP
ncbi:MAG: aspartate kinase [Thermoplasmata archaeon]|nr:aspartate kinase [Thermoplasmata archaeon]